MTQLSAALARKIAQTIADEIGAQTAQVNAAVGLLDEGATVPFIARYRKEATGGLDDTQLRTLEERLGYLRELEERRAAVIAASMRVKNAGPSISNSKRLPARQGNRTGSRIPDNAPMRPERDCSCMSVLSARPPPGVNPRRRLRCSTEVPVRPVAGRWCHPDSAAAE